MSKMPVSRPDHANFGKKLREAREQRGIDQTQLAERVGCQSSFVSLLESGRRAPSVTRLVQLADALEVTADHLLGRTSDLESSGPRVRQLIQTVANLSRRDLELLLALAGEMAARK